MKGERAYIGVGSNLGNRMDHCQKAMEAISRLPGVTGMVCSSLYESAPVPPASGGWFVNGVASAETTLHPEPLLRELQRLEQAMGRPKARVLGDDRSIDLDLLLLGSHVVERPEFVLPHPRLHLRRFVLVPFCELAPGLRHPVLRLTMRELLDRLDDPSQVRLLARAVHPATTA
ncbi:MAG TPA: 2-amino-4-hydroxy-6-hydroxymethyldihydropteridine diphosphokinase [Candidatus Methylomirabilis sp.]|nr:2-amino-4-hydroxy-6-hydroxymethyldihydropteridine diphosphokinase [Candidatus Methylomirabilis sp.]